MIHLPSFAELVFQGIVLILFSQKRSVCVCVCACTWLPAHVCVHLGYLFRGSHEVNGGVVVVVVLKQAEGKLVVDQQVV